MAIQDFMRTDYLTFEADQSITEMLGKLKLNGKRTGVVFGKGKYLGIVDRRALLRSSISTTDSKVLKCTIKAPLIDVDASVFDTALLMAESNLECLPVVKNNQIVGVIRALELLQAAAKMPEMKDLKVKDIKLAKPKPLRDENKVAEALRIMMMQKVDQVPVFTGKDISGVVRLKDLLSLFVFPQKKAAKGKSSKELGGTKAAAADRTKISALPVKSFATTNFKNIKRNDKLGRAINSMNLSNIWDLVVREDGKVYGLLTVKGILAKLATFKPAEEAAIQFTGLNKTHLTERQAGLLMDIAENEASKIMRAIKNEVTVRVHVKEYNQDGKPGKKHKYSITLKVAFPGQIVTGSQEDWKVQTAMRKAFNNVKNSIGSKFRGNNY